MDYIDFLVKREYKLIDTYKGNEPYYMVNTKDKLIYLNYIKRDDIINTLKKVINQYDIK